MARDKVVLDLWRADMDALHVLDLVAPVVTFDCEVCVPGCGGEDRRSVHALVRRGGACRWRCRWSRGTQISQSCWAKDLQFERCLLW
jgi:hypothetical protein